MDSDDDMWDASSGGENSDHNDRAEGSQPSRQKRPRVQQGGGSAAGPFKPAERWGGQNNCLTLPKHMHKRLQPFGALPTNGKPLAVKIKYEVDDELLSEVSMKIYGWVRWWLVPGMVAEC